MTNSFPHISLLYCNNDQRGVALRRTYLKIIKWIKFYTYTVPPSGLYLNLQSSFLNRRANSSLPSESPVHVQWKLIFCSVTFFHWEGFCGHGPSFSSSYYREKIICWRWERAIVMNSRNRTLSNFQNKEWWLFIPEKVQF